MRLPKLSFDNPQIQRLNNEEEDQYFEKKLPTIQVRELSAEISAFANTNPEGGLIAIGLSDKGGIILGMDRVGKQKINKLEIGLRDFIPAANIEYKLCPCKNSKDEDDQVLLMYIQFSPNRVVKDAGGSAFIRVGESSCKMNDDEIRELEIDKRQIDFELEPVNGASLEDLKDDLIKIYLENWTEQENITQVPNVHDMLVNNGFAVRREGELKLTNTGVLLFAKKPQTWFPGAKIRFLKYEGTTAETGQSLNITKDETIEGDLSNQIVETERIISEHLREFSRLDNEGRFITDPEYPKFCWFEGIVNAVVHRSYFFRNQNIFIRLFDDRIEIESPGNFPGIVTPENIYSMHFPRNPRLMDGFRILKLVKSASEGADRMRQLMREHKLPDPIFINNKTDHQVIVKLENNIDVRRPLNKEMILKDAIRIAVLNSASSREREILWYMLQNRNRIQTKEAERISNLSRKGTIEILRGMTEKVMIIRHGERGPGVFYKINDTIMKTDPNGSFPHPEMKAPDTNQKTLI